MKNNDIDIKELKRWLKVATQPYEPRYKAVKRDAQAVVTRMVPALIARLEAAEAVCHEAARFCEEINEDTGECDLDRLPDLHEALDQYEAFVEQAEAASRAEGE